MGRIATCLLLACTAAPVAAQSSARVIPADFDLPGARSELPRPSQGARAYPSETPRVPVDDALLPPQLLWSPSPASLVKVVPVKVRYKLKF